jgi:hypothetical protein
LGLQAGGQGFESPTLHKSLQTALLRCPYRRDRGPNAHLPCVLTPAKPACRRKSPQSLTAGRSAKALTTRRRLARPVCRDFPGPPTSPRASSRAHPAPPSIVASQHRRIEAEDRPKKATPGCSPCATRLPARAVKAATTGVTRLAPADLLGAIQLTADHASSPTFGEIALSREFFWHDALVLYARSPRFAPCARQQPDIALLSVLRTDKLRFLAAGHRRGVPSSLAYGLGNAVRDFQMAARAEVHRRHRPVEAPLRPVRHRTRGRSSPRRRRHREPRWHLGSSRSAGDRSTHLTGMPQSAAASFGSQARATDDGAAQEAPGR